MLPSSLTVNTISASMKPYPIGAAVSFGASILSDVVAGEEIDWVGAGVSAAFGAVSGALAASGVGALGSALASVAIDGTEYVVSSVIENKKVDLIYLFIL